MKEVLSYINRSSSSLLFCSSACRYAAGTTALCKITPCCQLSFFTSPYRCLLPTPLFLSFSLSLFPCSSLISLSLPGCLYVYLCLFVPLYVCHAEYSLVLFFSLSLILSFSVLLLCFQVMTCSSILQRGRSTRTTRK